MPTRCFPPGPCTLRSIACAPRDTPSTCAPTRGSITTYRTLKQPTSALPSKRPSADRSLPPAPLDFESVHQNDDQHERYTYGAAPGSTGTSGAARGPVLTPRHTSDV